MPAFRLCAAGILTILDETKNQPKGNQMTNTIAAPTKSKDATPPAQPRTPWTIPSRASDLEPEKLDAYIQLICIGTPAALAEASMIHSRAKIDSLEIADCRAALRLFNNANDPQPRRKVAKLEDKLATVRDEIERLQSVESGLETEVAQAERDTPNPDQFRRRLGIICTNEIVRQALREELEKAGV
jgi:hypothetical protein